LHTFAGTSITTLSIIVQKCASYLDHNDKIGMVGSSFRHRFLFLEGFATRMWRNNTLRANVAAHKTFYERKVIKVVKRFVVFMLKI
jgi:hypothetical protein